jgi:hypothetical protein
MKLLFRRKADGYIMRPIQTLPTCVRLRHIHSGLECLEDTVHLPANFDVLTHDIKRGDVLRDVRDGQLWVVERTYRNGLRMQTRNGGVGGNIQRGMMYFGLVNYERVGRKYCLRNRRPHERATYDATQVQAKMKRATHEIINRFDAVTNAQRQAREYGVGFIRVERDGSMNAIDPRSVILK